MNPGEVFEKESYEYLKNFYKHKQAKFDRMGGMDSTTSDIAVIKNNHISYYIEAKDSTAQSGQFVLLPNETENIFIFSPKNHSVPTEMTHIIIDYMNQNFDKYNNAGTAGIQLDIDSNIFATWIIEHYQDRNVKYFISRNKNFVVFPIRKFASYFDIKAYYRIKKSGSSDPAQRDFNSIKAIISDLYPSVVFNEVGKKLYAVLHAPLIKDKFTLGKYTYFFSMQEPSGLYRIRKLSNTYNMNVIFSIQLKKEQDPLDLAEFEADL